MITLLDDADLDGGAFLELLAQHNLGQGETECLAYALEFGYVISTDDRKTRRIIKSTLGEQKLIGSIGLLKNCVESGILTANEAKHSYDAMVRSGGFLPDLSQDFFDD